MLEKQFHFDYKKQERAKKAKSRKTKNSKKDIKPFFHKASKLCHPDTSNCDETIFKDLNNAYQENDYYKVLKIYNKLKT